jgi:tetratricopeptide (TPR) repeat protein
MEEDLKFLCVLCRKPTLMCCASCKNVFYCSEAHQIQHWNQHMHECVFSEEPSTEKSQDSAFEGPDISQPFDSVPDNSLIANEEVYSNKFKNRKEVLTLIALGKSAQASNIGRFYFNKVLSEYERNQFFDVYELLTDGVLLTKAYITSGELGQARQILMTLVSKIYSHSGSHVVKPASSFRPDESRSEKGILTFEDLKLKTSVYSTLAVLFSTCGDNINAEKMYVQYTKLISFHIGPASLESSNCYFMLGLFYQEQKLIEKSIAAFKKSEDIRIETLGDEHESVADCQYNLGLLFKKRENWFKANNCLQKALRIRIKHSGEGSLQVAQVYEAMGSLFIMMKDFKMAEDKLNNCLAIRKNLLKHCPGHEDLVRVNSLISHLLKKVTEEKKKEMVRRTEYSLINHNFSPDTSTNNPQTFRSLQASVEYFQGNENSHRKNGVKDEDSFQWLGDSPDKRS